MKHLIISFLIFFIRFFSVHCQRNACSNIKRFDVLCSLYKSYCTLDFAQTFLRKNCLGTCPNLCISTSQGVWGNWNIGACDVTCGPGKRTDVRRCMTGSCLGANTRVVDCNQPTCSTWGTWAIGSCDVTCGAGKRVDARRCLTGSCVGASSRVTNCTQPPCTSVWGQWRLGACSVSCGVGSRTDRRRCLTGNNCIGNDIRIQQCTQPTCSPRSVCRDQLTFCSLYLRFCAVGSLGGFLSQNCAETCPQLCRPGGGQAVPVFGPWTDVGTCTVSCGSGNLEQSRVCQSGPCDPASLSRTAACNNGPCPIPIRFSAWVNMGRCSATCGEGIQRQTRMCLSGSCAIADLSRTIPCREAPCPGVWSSWGTWSACNNTCGPGVQTRTRMCSASFCIGNIDTLTRSCNNPNCRDVNICSRTCGNGTFFDMMRNRYTDCHNGPCPAQSCPPSWHPYYGWRAHECCDASTAVSSSCGLKASQGRIIGGRPTTINNWPWMVQVRTGRSFCGGALISSNFVITAAHCLAGNSASVTLAIGVNRRLDFVTNRTAAEVILHENFNRVTFENDIALIRLNSPVDISAISTRPLCLPQGENVPDDLECVVAGWGVTSNSGMPRNDLLREVGIRILPTDICRRAYQTIVPDAMLCAGRVDGAVDSCTGDSGGPLMCQRCSSCEWMLVGITSFGGSLCAARNEPGVYARVVNFESWIYPKIDLTRPQQQRPSCS